MNIFIYVCKCVSVCYCRTYILDCVWWWHGQLCSSTRGPWSSKRRSAVLGKLPCQLLGTGSLLNEHGSSCSLWLLSWWSWWILFLKNNSMRYCYRICSSKTLYIFIGHNDFTSCAKRLTGKSQSDPTHAHDNLTVTSSRARQYTLYHSKYEQLILRFHENRSI